MRHFWQGDGAGFEVLSFDVSGDQKYIDVKTSKNGTEFRFNKVEFSEHHVDQYRLYRIFRIRGIPEIVRARRLAERSVNLASGPIQSVLLAILDR